MDDREPYDRDWVLTIPKAHACGPTGEAVEIRPPGNHGCRVWVVWHSDGPWWHVNGYPSFDDVRVRSPKDKGEVRALIRAVVVGD
jgi:hypothetical protein